MEKQEMETQEEDQVYYNTRVSPLRWNPLCRGEGAYH